MPDADGMHCEPIRDEDGALLGIARVSGPLTERDREAMRNLIEAAKRHQDALDAADPEGAVERVRRREESRRRIAERNARLRGDGGDATSALGGLVAGVSDSGIGPPTPGAQGFGDKDRQCGVERDP